MDYDPFRKHTVYESPIEAYLLRSALAGNPAGMFGAYATCENRNDDPFTPPADAPQAPVLPECFLHEASFEGRYWLSRAAHAGNLWAMEVMSRVYRGEPPAVAPDCAQVEYYQAMAVAGGAKKAAGIFARLYARSDVLPQNCARAVYYCAMQARLEGLGDIVLDDKTRSPHGELLQVMKEGFITTGYFGLGGTRVLFAPCLSEEEFNDAVERSKPAYEAAKAARDKDMAAHDALYEKARRQLPEIKAAYEAEIRAWQGEQ
jgi:hypothetical protein